MSVPKINGVQLSEPSAGPLLLLGNSIGTSATALWAASAAFLGERFHVVAWDLPGHGRNTDPVSDGFSMAELAAGVMAFAERVLTDRGEPGGQLYYAGDSLGGAVGLQALLDAPDRILAAVLLCTGAKIGDADGWWERAARVRASGTAVLINQSVERWFAPGFLERGASCRCTWFRCVLLFRSAPRPCPPCESVTRVPIARMNNVKPPMNVEQIDAVEREDREPYGQNHKPMSGPDTPCQGRAHNGQTPGLDG